MSTRSNIIIVTEDEKACQIYHHYDGYLSGVGDEIRKCVVYSLGLNSINKNIRLSDIIINEIIHYDDLYEYEYLVDLNTNNGLHADIEFLYIVKDGKLYYVNEWDICHKFNSYTDIINYVCIDKNMIDLTRKCNDK